jgi:hypothetical protein
MAAGKLILGTKQFIVIYFKFYATADEFVGLGKDL